MLGGTDLTLLLVSPRDINEALAAVRGGADILDIKNPEEGSLGANFPWIIASAFALPYIPKSQKKRPKGHGNVLY
ncbi:unnamed protein product [marine sediment metagenome]|uniref:(5-formylfuran-3-yl)methyl phosphate synthase n=1 Tax=marine sediment metagenome TaxID=412755 RepID=X1NJQ0_9ZZZZ